jgi:hypothetical protein
MTRVRSVTQERAGARQREWLRVKRFVVILLAACAGLACVHADTPPAQDTKLLFQAMTLLPGRSEEISLPERLDTGNGRIRVVVTIDRQIHRPPDADHESNDRVLFDGAKTARFNASVRTSRGRTVGHDTIELKNSDRDSAASSSVAFHFKLSLRESERVEQLRLRCDMKVTLLEVVWSLEP